VLRVLPFPLKFVDKPEHVDATGHDNEAAADVRHPFYRPTKPIGDGHKDGDEKAHLRGDKAMPTVLILPDRALLELPDQVLRCLDPVSHRLHSVGL